MIYLFCGFEYTVWTADKPTEEDRRAEESGDIQILQYVGEPPTDLDGDPCTEAYLDFYKDDDGNNRYFHTVPY